MKCTWKKGGLTTLRPPILEDNCQMECTFEKKGDAETGFAEELTFKGDYSAMKPCIHGHHNLKKYVEFFFL